jgi:hypothetical protein
MSGRGTDGKDGRRAPRDMVGRDVARPLRGRPRGSRPIAALLVGAMCAGLGLAALRIDILRLRYALAEAVKAERELLENQRVWTARQERQRDPARLAKLAAERGFSRPEKVIDLRSLRVAGIPRP